MGTCRYCLQSNLSRLYEARLKENRSKLMRGRCTCSTQEGAPIGALGEELPVELWLNGGSRNRRTNNGPVTSRRPLRTSDRIKNRSRLPSANQPIQTAIQTSNSNSTDEQHDCVICQDAETDTDKQRLPCGHSFHKLCVTTWLELTNSCPVCRQKLDITNGQLDFGQRIENITFRLGVVSSLLKRTQEVTSLVMENVEKQLNDLSRNLPS
ncbi:uncharacterized protein [Parasteatoda tepidariorum]|uniref:uncharacterized protein n=1 Tax=Parasteatoda tepidariorum TaxID=114398 RepID=UPI00077FA54B|nr:probable E3 ubiquitin-protein ligase RHC1A [Parasteatoda tepidariorum]XP_015918328.1 probable E3 ubiquitin-protein ligase RHC1A [Parasteatoda tepidariorum]